MNEYFEFENPFIPGTLVRAEEVNEVFSGVEVGFDGVKVQVDRTVRLPIGSSGDLTLATPLNRALRVIGFDVDGNIQLRSSFAYVGDWMTGADYKMNSVFRDPVSKNLYTVTVDHTSTTIAEDLTDQKIILAVNVADVFDATAGAQQAAIESAASADASEVSNLASADSASESLGFRNEAEGFRDEAETFSLTAINAPGTSATSLTSHTLGAGTPKVFAIQPGKEFVTGQFVVIASNADPADYFVAQVISNDQMTGTLTVDIIAFEGTGTFSDWTISLTSVSTQGVTIVTRSDSVFYRVLLAEDSGNTLVRGSNGMQNLDYNPSTGTLRSVAFVGALTGNASTATTLETAREINGTSFNGSANITTDTWGTARTITIGTTGKSINGSANVSWSLAEIGAPATDGTGATGTWNINITGNAGTATSATSATSAGSATNSANVNVTTTAANANYALVFSPSQTTGQKALLMDSSGGTYNPATNTAELNITGTAGNATNLGGLSSSRTLQKRRTDIQSPANIDTAVTAPEFGFVYTSGNAPTSGPFIAFGGLGGDIDYSCQLVANYVGGNDFFIRTRNDDANIWNPWRTLLHNSNFNSFAPTLTGGGASGTWNISITGTAQNANTLNGFGSDTAASANSVMRRDASGNAYWQYGNQASPNGENPSISQFMITNGDNFIRKATLAHVSNSLASSLNAMYVLKDQLVGEVGSYAFMRYEVTAGSNLTPNQTVPASSLRFGSLNSGVDIRDTVTLPSGTWRCLGGGPVQVTTFTLFQRIA